MSRLSAIFLSLAVLWATTNCSRTVATEAVRPGPVAFKTAVVQARPVQPALDIPARVQADPTRVVRVYPPAGGRLVRVTVRPGDAVARGQVVAVLESSDVAQARSDLAKADAEANRTERALHRAQLLRDHKVLSEREYEDALSQQIQARSEQQRAQARLRVLGVAPGSASNEVSVVAPLAGAVLDIGASSGELSKSTDNANPICTIADLSMVWVTGDVYEKDLTVVRPGAPVVVQVPAYPGRSWVGKVAQISDAIDPTTRTAKVRVVLSNPRRELKPEMFATARLQRPASEELVIPGAAVLREGGDSAVMVKTGDNSFERRLITFVALGNGEVAVKTGLKAGEVVATEGAALLRGAGD
jgi:cobalt-zinc-cadmium efflux system membrane fusion protein